MWAKWKNTEMCHFFLSWYIYCVNIILINAHYFVENSSDVLATLECYILKAAWNANVLVSDRLCKSVFVFQRRCLTLNTHRNSNCKGFCQLQGVTFSLLIQTTTIRNKIYLSYSISFDISMSIFNHVSFSYQIDKLSHFWTKKQCFFLNFLKFVWWIYQNTTKL